RRGGRRHRRGPVADRAEPHGRREGRADDRARRRRSHREGRKVMKQRIILSSMGAASLPAPAACNAPPAHSPPHTSETGPADADAGQPHGDGSTPAMDGSSDDVAPRHDGGPSDDDAAAPPLDCDAGPPPSAPAALCPAKVLYVSSSGDDANDGCSPC